MPARLPTGVSWISRSEPREPRSSSLLNRTTISPKSCSRCSRIRASACSTRAMPHLASATPGPRRCRPRCGTAGGQGAGGIHGVHVRHQQHAAPALAAQRGHQVVGCARRHLGRHALDKCGQRGLQHVAQVRQTFQMLGGRSRCGPAALGSTRTPAARHGRAPAAGNRASSRPAPCSRRAPRPSATRGARAPGPPPPGAA